MNRELWENKTALLVDDSATSRTIIQQLMKTLPIELSLASSAGEFYEMTRDTDFHLLLIDYRLPDDDGMNLVREHRRRCQSSTVVLITGQAQVETATDALAEGADGFVDKHHLDQGPEAFRQTLERAILSRERRAAQWDLQRHKEEFHTLIAHDLRNPATCISVALQMYKDNPREEVLDTALDALDRLFYRLDRYLDFSRMNSGFAELVVKRQCLAQLVSSVVSALDPLAKKNAQTIGWDIPSGNYTCDFDWHWMYQAVENLLSNSIKHGRRGASIWVQLEKEKDEFVLTVSDDGPGIAHEDRPTLFQRFYRSSGSRSRGTGLGLSIVKKVVSLHGGTVRLESNDESREGSTFVIRIPSGQ